MSGMISGSFRTRILFKMILHIGEYSISQLAAFAPEKPLDLHQLNSFNPAMRKGIKSTCGFSIIMLLTLLTYLATSSADSVGKGKLTRLGNCEIQQGSKKKLNQTEPLVSR